MILCKFDTVRSTEALERRGHDVTVGIRTQLAAVVTRLFASLLTTALPTSLRFTGERQGDGLMVGAPRAHAIEMLREAMTLQAEPPWQHPTWLPVRMAVGIAEVTWDGAPYSPGSVPNGRDIVILSRLLETECPAGSVVVNEPLLRHLREYDRPLFDLFEERDAELKGIEGRQKYGLIPPRKHPALLPLVTRWKQFAASSAGVVVLTLGVLAWAAVAWWGLGR